MLVLQCKEYIKLERRVNPYTEKYNTALINIFLSIALLFKHNRII